MMSEIQFENAIIDAWGDFKRRLEQQRMFQIQNNILKKLQEEVKSVEYGHFKQIENLSLTYENFYQKLSESGRSYENIVKEKNLVDTYSAFEKFLFDCFCAIYTSFPKHLGDQISVNTLDLFMSENVELCKKNFIESKVQQLIQSNNIIGILGEFKKKFSIDISVSEDEKNILYEISLVRNLIIHNDGIVNSIYEQQIKKSLQDKVKYEFNQGDTVLNKLEDVAQDIVDISPQICEKIAHDIINDSKRLEKHHENI